ncbi:bifunctional 4-hydroxy-2-oxoglutarate aldolase/2-dehydro-3-deoxy-phosphogluconate aldolase [Pedobacter glucosidilyticus]|uniref:bifunctional 4-hydroxy-2-oxoglutarate aldolase/2-dehydro-3-deoxy-phosphogluconate aldolase n=1 Tax=Pedobacter glucosidilyticus TaxID=1122941 RepID=UPI000403CFCB|nr:ketohydroxyglutarate aldolase [Pedobacter glucosidilyticus]
MPHKQTVLDTIIGQGMLPLFYHEDKELSLAIIKTLYEAGVKTLEYTNRGPAALENFRYLKSQLKDLPDFYLGIGTIKNTKEAQDFIDAGADYIVCPTVNIAVGQLVNSLDMLWIPGCMTPTEISTAQGVGALLIKLFPANVLGTGFVSAIRELFVGQHFMPTGGVEIEEKNIREWFKAGVSAVGMGSKLISKDVMQNRALDELAKNTAEAFRLIKLCK